MKNMEMEVENALNDGGTAVIEDNDKAETPREDEDSIFAEMRSLQSEDDSQNKSAIPDAEITITDICSDIVNDKETSESIGKDDLSASDSNPQIQMEDLKVAEEEMTEVDVVVCGGCHTVFHFVEDLSRHKPQCTRKSNFRNIVIEDKPQVWAFLLWKNAQGKHVSKTGSIVEESSWKLYQKWCKMSERIRNAWIAAGGAVMNYTTFGNKQSAPPTPPSTSPPPIHTIYAKPHKLMDKEIHNGDLVESVKPVVMRKLVQRDHTGEIKDIRSPDDPPPPKPITLKDEIESIRNQLEGNDSAANNSSSVENGGTLREEEFVVEKIVSRRFNPKKKQYEYLLKWEGYPSEQNTWEPAENLETCKHLLKQFEENLAKQNITKAKTVKKISDMISLPGPSSGAHGRPVRHSKQKALTQVKQWCGSIKPDDIDVKKRYDFDSDEDDFLIKRMRMTGESDSEDSLMGPPARVSYKTHASDTPPPVKRKVGRPPKNRNLINGVPVNQTASHPPVEPNLAAALGLESDSEDSPLAVLNQRAAATRVSNLSPLNQQVLVANAKGVVKVDPSQVPNLTSGVYIMSNKSIVKLDSVTPSKALALKEQQVIHKDVSPVIVNKQQLPEPQVVMIKNSGSPIGQKSGIVRKNPGILKSPPVIGRTPRPLGSIRNNTVTPGTRLQSGIVPRSSVAGVTSGIRPRGTVHNVRVPNQKKIEPEKKILIGTKAVARGALKSGIHRKSSIPKTDDVETKLREWKSGEPADIFEDLPESESSESDVGIPDDFPKDIGPIEPASPPRPLTLCPLTGKVLAKAEGEKTPEPTPPPSPNSTSINVENDVSKKGIETKETISIKMEPVEGVSLSSQPTVSTAPKALFVNTNSTSNVVKGNVTSVGKPLFVNTSQGTTSTGSGTVLTASALATGQSQQHTETVISDSVDDDMVTITGEDGLVYKVSNSDLGSLLGGEEGEQCVYVTEGDDGDTVLALAQYHQGGTTLGSLTDGGAQMVPSTTGTTLTAESLGDEQQQFYVKQEVPEGSELVTLQQETEEPQVIAQLIEASEPAPGGQRRVVLLLPDGNLMMTEVDEEQYAALELDK